LLRSLLRNKLRNKRWWRDVFLE